MPLKYTHCTVPGCSRNHAARGYCHPHYWRWRKHGDPGPSTIYTKADLTAEERFWSKVDRSGGDDACWTWTGKRSSRGYGVFTDKKRGHLAHRTAWRLTRGAIPDGLLVCHACDNPPCCNPAHLWLGTVADNAADMVAKGRSATGDRNGMRTHPERTSKGTANGAHKYRGRFGMGLRNGSYTHPERRPRGEGIGNSKLTEAEVIAIRLAYAAGGTSQSALGKQFGVTQGAIYCIVHRKTWDHV